MNTLHLAVVCPVSGLPQNTDQARREVWAEVTNLLQPDLGKLYDSFYPASSAWGMEWNVPYGVLLGREDPERLIRLLVTAEKARDNAIDFHTEALLAGVNPDQTQEIGNTLICPVHLDGTNKALEMHTFWHFAMSTGVLLPDCGIYYLAQKKAFAGPELRKTISGNLAGYAVCVVVLEVDV